jgi:hypothetical protein
MALERGGEDPDARSDRLRVAGAAVAAQLEEQAFVAPPSFGDEACAVCLEPVNPGQRCVSGPECLHRLHSECAVQLAAASSTRGEKPNCPTCRSSMLVADCAGGCSEALFEEAVGEYDGALAPLSLSLPPPRTARARRAAALEAQTQELVELERLLSRALLAVAQPVRQQPRALAPSAREEEAEAPQCRCSLM